jgi:hypothetical protein
MRTAILDGAGRVLAALLSSMVWLAPTVARAEGARCFDWAVAARLESQTYLGEPDPGPGLISLTSAFEWKAKITKSLIGRNPPRRVTVVAGSHTELQPWAAKRVVLFLQRRDGQQPVLLRARVLERNLPREAWPAEAQSTANAMNLRQCEAAP